MYPDRPIQKKEEDAFERLSFAEHLSNFLCLKKDAPSIVIGIEGKWGDGKTSCINLVREVLSMHSPKPIVVDYRPWLISTLDSVIEGFFVELASAFGTQSKSETARKAAHKVLQFGKMLAPIKLIPGVEPWGTMVESVLTSVGQAAKSAGELTNLSLQTRKADLQRSLRQVDRPLVVIIDDVDRLPPEHVRIVFQMIKAVCDFDRVSYLIAYDPKPIESALSYDGIYDGKRYLEKIVQVSYPLPRLSFTHLKRYLKDYIQTVIDNCGLGLTGSEVELFELALNKTDLVRILETPRDVILLCNKLRLSAPNTKKEVSFADLVIFETLEVKFPELSRIIRTEPDRFVADEEFTSGDTIAAFHIAFTRKEKEEKSSLDDLLDRVDCDERKKDGLKSLLLFMFPRLSGKDNYLENIPENINRIKNRDAFLKLLHCGITSFTYSTEQARRFCLVPEERQQILAEYRDANDLYNWISYLMRVAVDSEIEDAVGLCALFLDEMRGPEEQRSFASLPHLLGQFLYVVIKSRKDTALRREMLNILVSSNNSLSLSESTLLDFLIGFGIWKRGKYLHDIDAAKAATTIEDEVFTHEELYAAKDRWLTSVREVAAGEGILETQKDVLSILHRWGQFNNNNYSEAQEYIMTCSASKEWLKKYLRLFNSDTITRDILGLIPKEALDAFIERVDSLVKEDKHAVEMADFLRQVSKAKDGDEQPTNK